MSKLKLFITFFIFIILNNSSIAQKTLIPFRVKNLWGYSDPKGKMLIPAQFIYEPGWFNEGLAMAADSNGLYGFINEKGDFVIKPQYLEVKDFKNNLCWVKKYNGWALINQFGGRLF